MEWPRRRGCRFAVVALLVIVLASTRYAPAARRGGVFVVDVAASDSAGRASASMLAREAAYRMVALHTSYGSRGDDVGLKECPHATDTRRAEAIGLSRINSSAVHRAHGKLMIAVPQKGNVTLGMFDAAVGDVTITEQPSQDCRLYNALLANKDSKPTIQWIFLKPLTKELWLTTVGFFFFTGFVAWMIERPRNQEYQGSSLAQASTALYFAFSTLTFSHDLWANYKKSSVKNHSCDMVLFSAGSSAKLHRKLVIHAHRKETPARGDRSRPAEYAEALRNGTVSAIADEIPYLSYVFPRGCPLVHNLSIAILGLTAGNESLRLEQKWFGKATPSTADSSPIADSTALTLRSFSGLFVITGCVSTLMLLIRIVRSVYAKCTRVRGSGLQDADADGGSKRLEESRALQDDMGYGSVPDQSHHEVRSEHSMGAHGSGRSVDNEDTGPIQNGMHNGSVPAFSVRVEMCGTEQGEYTPFFHDICGILSSRL
ncbi:hypothetical protein EJB05_45889, partial [Eragrostis curvula]